MISASNAALNIATSCGTITEDWHIPDVAELAVQADGADGPDGAVDADVDAEDARGDAAQQVFKGRATRWPSLPETGEGRDGPGKRDRQPGAHEAPGAQGVDCALRFEGDGAIKHVQTFGIRLQRAASQSLPFFLDHRLGRRLRRWLTGRGLPRRRPRADPRIDRGLIPGSRIWRDQDAGRESLPVDKPLQRHARIDDAFRDKVGVSDPFHRVYLMRATERRRLT